MLNMLILLTFVCANNFRVRIDRLRIRIISAMLAAIFLIILLLLRDLELAIDLLVPGIGYLINLRTLRDRLAIFPLLFAFPGLIGNFDLFIALLIELLLKLIELHHEVLLRPLINRSFS